MVHLSLLLLAILLEICSANDVLYIPSPPTIVIQPSQSEQFYHVALTKGESIIPVILKCEAEGDPQPLYYWTKNGKRFDLDLVGERVTQLKGVGTLNFSHPQASDEGRYQCFAKNPYGVSLSNSVFLRKSELNFFPKEKIKKIEVKEGLPLSLNCYPPKGHPQPYVFWMIQPNSGEPRNINSSRVTLDPEGGLHFSYVTLGDSFNDAVYSCFVSSLFRNELKTGNKRKLIVIPREIGEPVTQQPVRQYVSPANKLILRGDDLQLACIYGGMPIPTVKWYFTKKGPLPSERLGTPIKIGKILKITNISSDNEGIYQCIANNGVGSEQKYSVTVIVESLPYWNVSPTNTQAAEDENVRFECSASGIPPPKLHWLINGEAIEVAESNPRRIIKGNVMTISNLVKTDTAVYQCNGSNIHGYTFKNFYLNILSIPPTMQEPPKNITYAVVGSKRIIKCQVYGVPQPQVNWKKDNQELVGSRFQTSNSGILELTNISKEDEGQYTCIATNKYGSLQASGNLEVKAKTKITLAPENVEVSINKKAVLHCEAEADPTLPLTIKWHFNGEPIDYHLDTRLIQTEDQSFVINMAKDSDSGIYTCIAETFIDKDSAWANLIVQNVPEPPVFKEVKCEVHVADIQWEPRGNGHAPILGYNIQYNTSFNPNVWENSFLNVPPTDTHFKVLMSPWTNYTFRVVAFNKIGSSQPSEHSKQCSTPLDTPHKHPSNVKGEGTNPDNIVVSWKPMPKIEHNAPGLFYKVFWKRDDIPDSRWNVVTIRDWKQESFLVDQQPTFKPYKIKVEAHNSLGNAKITAPEVIGYSGEDVPLEAPQNFQLLMILDGRRAKFAWNAVSSTSIRGHFKGYKVRTWAIGDGQHWREQDFSPNATEGIVTVLKPFAKNFAEVAVINQRYIGPPSQTITFTTPQGVPGAVASFSAYPLGINSLYLIWKKPDEANGILTGYKIFYSEVNGTILGIKKEHLPPLSNPDATRLKLTGLIPQTKYRVTIQATTQVGAGEPRYIEVMTGSEDHKVPGVPIFIWSQIHDDKEDVILKVTWLPALDDHLGSHFFVQYRLKGDSAWTNTISELENDYTMITNLEMNAVYELRVVSVDGPYETPSLIAEVKIGNHAAPFVQPVEESGIPLWLIAPVCCIILLAIILVIIYLVRQNAGGKYPVYEKEVALGSENNCLDEGGFDEYNKPSSNHHLLNGSRVSLASSLAPPLSETDSMAEYGGEGDTGKFTEDGSFIGQYGKVKSPEEESGLSTPASPLV